MLEEVTGQGLEAGICDSVNVWRLVEVTGQCLEDN
jgi:hypothetical protein